MTGEGPSAGTAAISCVICTVDRPQMIARAVSSVLEGDLRAFELVVIDQSQDDATRKACERFTGDARFRYIHSDRRGLSAAYNRGIAETRAPLIAFTDDDCVARRDWLSSMAAVFEDERIDMLYGQTLRPADEARQAGIIPELPFLEPRIIGRGHGLEVVGMGANFALRRELAERLGGFDEALGGGGPLRSSQDFDFQYRAYRAGALVRLSPEPKVDHYGVRAPGTQWHATLEAYGIGDGAFYWKHVRCGDVTALRLFVQRLAKLALREVLMPVRRRNSQLTYMRACITGIRRSRGFSIDKQARLYVLPEGGS